MILRWRRWPAALPEGHYVGAGWLGLMIRHGRLAPNHAVLDIGCGCGRMAGPLTMYLNARGSYRGFDPVKKSIDYAQTYLDLPNFRFEFTDLHHYLYNPQGVIDPSTFRFPAMTHPSTFSWRDRSSRTWI